MKLKTKTKYNLLTAAQCVAIMVLVNNTDPTWITVTTFVILMLGTSYCAGRTIK